MMISDRFGVPFRRGTVQNAAQICAVYRRLAWRFRVSITQVNPKPQVLSPRSPLSNVVLIGLEVRVMSRIEPS